MTGANKRRAGRFFPNGAFELKHLARRLGRVVQGGTKKNEHRRRVSWWRPAAAQLDLFGARGS